MEGPPSPNSPPEVQRRLPLDLDPRDRLQLLPIPQGERDLLIRICEHDPATFTWDAPAKRLAELLGCHPGTVTRRSAKCAAAGLLDVESRPGRPSRLTITPAAIAGQVLPQPNRRQRRAASSASVQMAPTPATPSAPKRQRRKRDVAGELMTATLYWVGLVVELVTGCAQPSHPHRSKPWRKPLPDQLEFTFALEPRAQTPPVPDPQRANPPRNPQNPRPSASAEPLGESATPSAQPPSIESSSIDTKKEHSIFLKGKRPGIQWGETFSASALRSDPPLIRRLRSAAAASGFDVPPDQFAALCCYVGREYAKPGDKPASMLWYLLVNERDQLGNLCLDRPAPQDRERAKSIFAHEAAMAASEARTPSRPSAAPVASKPPSPPDRPAAAKPGPDKFSLLRRAQAAHRSPKDDPSRMDAVLSQFPEFPSP